MVDAPDTPSANPELEVLATPAGVEQSDLHSPANPGSSPESTQVVAESTLLPVTDNEPLPEWEELTPELFEDECVRGDFMLRWASVLLAILFGSTYLTESSVLVQIRTGQTIQQNGFLPPRTDPFAVATEGEPWVNLHWLTDLIIGTTERLGGVSFLSILTALKLGLSFWILSRITYRDVSTWWSSLCAVIAILAVFPAIQPGEQSMTILGFSLLLALLHRWREKPASTSLWGLPVLFAVWSNVDARAWTGLLCFAVFLIVDLLLRKVTKRQLMIGISAIVAGVLVSPWPLQPVFGYQDALAHAAQAQEEGLSGELFPRYVYGMLAPEFWQSPDLFPVAATVLLVLAFFSLFLNANRLDWSMTVAWMTFNGLSFYFGELVPYGAIVNCVVAGLNGQDWFRSRFPANYSINSVSVFLARAGRAVTVMTFFAIAYTGINGILMGPEGRRIGMGFDPRLKNRLDSTEHDLLPGIYGDRAFNVRADQGDMLIWFGKKPYLDSRSGLFVNSKTKITERHRQLRASIFSQGPLSKEVIEGAEPVSWKEEFSELNIQSLILRLWGEQPAYSPFLMLIGTQEWPMTGFGAAGGVFTRGDVTDHAVKTHIEQTIQTGFIKEAYQLTEKDKKVPDTTQIWPRPVSNYEQWLYQKIPVTPNSLQLARHYNVIAIRLQQGLAIDQGMALAVLATRSALRGLSEAPDHPDVYRVFIDAQSLLEQAEQRFLAANGQNYGLAMRSQLQLSHAFHAAKASGNALEDMRRLFVFLVGQQNLDLASEVADRYFEQTGKPIMLADDGDEAAFEQATSILKEINAHVEQVKTQIEEARGENTPGPQLAGIALNGRCPKLAMTLLEEDLTLVASDPRLQLTYASLLQTNGRTEEAWEQIEGMQPVIERLGGQAPAMVSQWRMTAAIVSLAASVRERPAELFAEDAAAQNSQNLQALLVNPPGSANPAPALDLWAGLTARAHASALAEFPERWAAAKLQVAMVRIDQGDLKQAEQALRAIVTGHPEFSMRSLVVLYLTLITGEQFEFEPPSAHIPIWGEMFAPDSEGVLQKSEPSSESLPSAEKRPPSPDLPELLEE